MKIGFIGLGNVGGKLAGSLLRNGFDVTVHDLNPDLVAEFVPRGAKPTSGPLALMQDLHRIAKPGAEDPSRLLGKLGPWALAAMVGVLLAGRVAAF